MSRLTKYDSLPHGALTSIVFNSSGRFLHSHAERPERKFIGSVTYFFLDGVETGYKCDGCYDAIAISREWGPNTRDSLHFKEFDTIQTITGRIA